MKKLRIVATVFVALVLGLVILASTKPDTFMISESIEISVDADRIFPLVDDLHAWAMWSSFEKDPNMQKTFEGPQSGVGSSMAWNGDKNVGVGKMSIIESVPSERVKILLEMYSPFASINDVEFLFMSHGPGSTIVTWTMTGQASFMSKIMNVIMGDKMVRGMFREGLQSMKTLAERNG